ncbi:cysteine desulfurase family protein [Agrobacterium tumefaciens]|uniref:cysteine desulfurase family protein n=1 Tax=Agrobacterium tumefaciens TaxID=358 RepID=UPI003BA070BF
MTIIDDIIPVYLDGFSTLPLAPEARDKMFKVWGEPGNAGSPHSSGEAAARMINDARNIVADLIGASQSEVFFTSGATEANNLAILGVARDALRSGNKRRRIIVSSVEHKSVLEPAKALVELGFSVFVAPVDKAGRLDIDQFAALVDDDTLLVSIMTVNNETGVIQPISEVSAIAREVGAFVHSDCAQGVGKIAIDVLSLDIDYMSISAHKCYGPMGVGALYISAGAPKPAPLTYGGGQQSGVRPGTEPVPLIVGFGEAAKLVSCRSGDSVLDARAAHLFDGLAARQVRLRRITGDHPVVPGSLAIAIDGVDADALCTLLARSVQMSTGSACTSGQIQTSHVLESMGFSREGAREVIRLFVNRYTTDPEIDAAIEVISSGVQRLKSCIW